jgi:hypothetical protein
MRLRWVLPTRERRLDVLIVFVVKPLKAGAAQAR